MYSDLELEDSPTPAAGLGHEASNTRGSPNSTAPAIAEACSTAAPTPQPQAGVVPWETATDARRRSGPDAPMCLPGPAGLMQAAIAQGKMPERLADLSHSMLGRGAECLHATDTAFAAPLWLQACAEQRLPPTLSPAEPDLTTARELAASQVTRTARMLLMLVSTHRSAGGDAFVSLKDPTGLVKGSMSGACFAMHDTLRRGAVLSLQACAVVRPTDSDAYVCVTPANIARVHRNGAAQLALPAPSVSAAHTSDGASRSLAELSTQPELSPSGAGGSCLGGVPASSMVASVPHDDDADIELEDDFSQPCARAANGCAAAAAAPCQTPLHIQQHSQAAPRRQGLHEQAREDVAHPAAAAPSSSASAAGTEAAQAPCAAAGRLARRGQSSMAAQLQAMARSKAGAALGAGCSTAGPRELRPAGSSQVPPPHATADATGAPMQDITLGQRRISGALAAAQLGLAGGGNGAVAPSAQPLARVIAAAQCKGRQPPGAHVHTLQPPPQAPPQATALLRSAQTRRPLSTTQPAATRTTAKCRKVCTSLDVGDAALDAAGLGLSQDERHAEGQPTNRAQGA